LWIVQVEWKNSRKNMEVNKKIKELEEEYKRNLEIVSKGKPGSQEYIEAIKKIGIVEEILEYKRQVEEIERKIEELKGILENEEEDLKTLIEEEIEKFEKEKKILEEKIKEFFSPESSINQKNAIVEIRAGVGGEEASLFARDLFRMYSKFCERKNYEIEVLSSNTTELGGIKEIIFLVKGKGAYGNFRFESGVHRVQRIPETESYGRIHTSAATVSVFPEVEENEIKIDQKDLKIETFRASGHGGQHVNKTSSAVRITHIPTGITVSCQDERSQFKNKSKAMKILKARIQKLYEDEKKSKIDSERKKQVKTGERSEKIRTYNFPQNRITDHRINLTLYNLDDIMDGNLDKLISALKGELK